VDAESFWAERADEVEEYARLALRVGVNLRHGQDVVVVAHVEHAPLVRAIARVAYAEGARGRTLTTSTTTCGVRRPSSLRTRLWGGRPVG
jgi:leucyl aminopeptidase (aminopeptidase T)